MHKKLIIIGASGHGKVVADIAERLHRYEKIVFLDDDDGLDQCMGYQIIGKSDRVKEYLDVADFFVAIGNAKIRKKIMEQLQEQNASIATLIHPVAIIGSHVTIGKGTVVMAGAVINSDTQIGNGCIINTCASVDHDCQIGDYVHVAVGAHVCGTVEVGENTWIGAGATIRNNVSICADCIIGAGAVVIKDITEKGTYVGVPARRNEEINV